MSDRLAGDGLLAGLWDPSCPFVAAGDSAKRCIRESPVDRLTLLPLFGGLIVGAAGGGTVAFGALQVAIRAWERRLVISAEGAGPCPIEPSTGNALADVLAGALGWWLGERLRGGRD